MLARMLPPQLLRGPHLLRLFLQLLPLFLHLPAAKERTQVGQDEEERRAGVHVQEWPASRSGS
jgi:hypothetical protein